MIFWSVRTISSQLKNSLSPFVAIADFTSQTQDLNIQQFHHIIILQHIFLIPGQNQEW